MSENAFKLSLFLPAQGASETEATIIEWCVAEGDHFSKGQVLAQVDSAKSVFDFEAPCDGLLIHLLHSEGDTVAYDRPVAEIETADEAMKDWIPPAAAEPEIDFHLGELPAHGAAPTNGHEIVLLGVGGYLPSRVVTNAELVEQSPDVQHQYVHQVTGIRERRWAEDGEKPSDMAYAAALEAIRKSRIDAKEIDAVVLATTTPDVAMPSTACILQDRLNLRSIPAFDLNAACSGWLYAVAMARGMIVTGMARNVLTVGVDLQSRLLDRLDRNAYFLFGDGAGAAVISADRPGHRIREMILGADTRGLNTAYRRQPGYAVANGNGKVDPWIRLDGPALFRLAADRFAGLIREASARSGWSPSDLRWIVPHQANGRLLKAAARRSGAPFDRFHLNIERVGNTSSASIPLALLEIEEGLQPDDKLLFCSVGAGMTTAAVTVEW